MAEVKYESVVTSSPSSVEAVYGVCGNLKNLSKVDGMLPKDKISDIEYAEDYVRFKIDGLGQKICLRIVDREENKTIKFAAENSPITMNFWIQMKPNNVGGSLLKLTIKADMPLMFKMMLDSKIQKGLDDGARMMAQMPFEQWNSEL